MKSPLNRFWSAFGLCLLALLSACATVHPQIDRPPELALDPAPITHWPGLQDLTRDDIFVPMNIGPAALSWRLRALPATSSIDLQTFIWQDDTSGKALTREIVAAAERGVRVRVLLDDSFLAHADPALRALSEHPLINYRIYNPVANRHGGTEVRELLNLEDFSRINHRMHNKLLLVDGRVAIVGGRNQADEYFGYRQDHNFRDFEVIVTGPITSSLSTVFDLYWNDPWTFAIEDLANSELSRPEIDTWLDEGITLLDHPEPASEEEWKALFAAGHQGSFDIIVDTPAGDDPAVDLPIQLASAYIDLIDTAEQDLLLVSAYFIPTPELTDAMERAIARGVAVRILTNSLGSNNHVPAHAAYARHRPALLRAGVDVYELRADASTRAIYTFESLENGILGLHAKLALFDECCLLVGSSNLDPRSLRLNTEIGVVVDSPGLNQHLRDLIAVDMLPANAWRLTLSDDDKIVWHGPAGEVRNTPPASFFMRSESWFFGLLPIEDQM